jgi:hypothetical protein
VSDDFQQQLEHVAALVAERTRADEQTAQSEQLLYENWLKQDRWDLGSEGLPLLFGADPADWADWLKDGDFAAAADQLYLRIKNRVLRNGDDGVTPLSLYQLARSAGYAVPPAYERLIQFIVSTVKSPLVVTEPDGGVLAGVPATAASGAREQVVGAAFSILSKWPERCRDERGMVDAERIVSLIESQPVLWFNAPQSPLAHSEMIGLLNRWLE